MEMFSKWAADGWQAPAPSSLNIPTEHKQQINELRKEAAAVAQQHQRQASSAADSQQQRKQQHHADEQLQPEARAAAGMEEEDQSDEDEYMGPLSGGGLDDPEGDDEAHTTHRPSKRSRKPDNTTEDYPQPGPLSEEQLRRAQSNREAAMAKRAARLEALKHDSTQSPAQLTEEQLRRIQINREAAAALRAAKLESDKQNAERKCLVNAIAAGSGAGLGGLRRAMDLASSLPS